MVPFAMAAVFAAAAVRSNPPSDVVHAIDAGAVCDGQTDDTVALQGALNSTALNGSILEIPAGRTCLTQPLKLPSHTRLHLGDAAVIKAGAKWTDGVSMLYTAGVYDSDHTTTDIHITGKGTLDGSGVQWWTGSNKTPNRPKLLELDATGVEIKDITLLDAASWHSLLMGAHYEIIDVTIRSPNYTIAPNTDGLDIAAHYVHISGADITNGDDSICMKTPAKDVLVENSIVRQGNGLVVGTSDKAAFQNITFRSTLLQPPCTVPLSLCCSVLATLKRPASQCRIQFFTIIRHK
eukprot:m.71652 g.71652  ORF g.71652 m.71652 type:complete len:293 (+) comp18653_c0_seq1:1963-2841(+)